MGTSHGVHIEKFAARGNLALERPPIPGSPSHLMPMFVRRSCHRSLRFCLRGIRLGLCRSGADADGGKYGACKDCWSQMPMGMGCNRGHCSPIFYCKSASGLSHYFQLLIWVPPGFDEL